MTVMLMVLVVFEAVVTVVTGCNGDSRGGTVQMVPAIMEQVAEVWTAVVQARGVVV